MNYKLLTGAALLAASPLTAQAQDTGRVNFESDIEIGFDSTFKSDVAANELTDNYAAVNASIDFELTENLTFFTALTLESVLDPVGNRTLGDMGFYIGELGLAFTLGGADISVGKISPAFGIAWDVTPGFYATGIAEDYELAEMIGATVDTQVGGGDLSFALFYADDTVLSASMGTNRGRNTTAAGGAGNTGSLNNIALQWSKERGKTTYILGARYLTAGTGDPKNETGISLGFVHALNDNVEIIGELAAFNGYGGSTDKATYATLGASFGNGPLTYSGAVSYRDVTSAGSTSMVTVGLDYEFDNGVTLGGGYAFSADAGVDSHQIGMSVIIPVGG
ncbi:hypothetical protein [Profundibacter sp.]